VWRWRGAGVFSGRICTLYVGLAYSLARTKNWGVGSAVLAVQAGAAVVRSGGIFGKELHVLRRARVLVSAQRLGCRVQGALAAPAGAAVVRSEGIFGKELHVLRRAGVFVSARRLGVSCSGALAAPTGATDGAERGFREGFARIYSVGSRTRPVAHCPH